ncbi:glycoside hydrolase family 3 protein [Alteromonas sp. 1_MG-2023]|uniref:glycoside hydrolase family 3 N-terminal domain-containing protein n=1 Tax=Alteromonas sp. 1_MG-2023 TaxID=3062669 RepID=UPI0026E3E8DE|nr:glycoside hydrolase family 3 protein [Alteromonas sp. 1_MG-2023]MDO6568963.1 glycoside hydrolase family 3 protein [Alteromonas sp. 1_MG-2023]
MPSTYANQSNQHEQIKKSLGQKVILDFRFYCDDGTSSKACKKPVTTLPSALKEILVTHNIGGVILFSENIKTNQQLITLNYGMQQAMVKAKLPPLFIAVDQEGGRVARLPSSMLTPFPGNLAIGASYYQHGTAFAENVARGIGSSLTSLGINTNFAPSVDINSEPKNPVINVRSFGETPSDVAVLGQSFVDGLQASGVISAIKHFPGHGDTQTDSHTGLPKVGHSKAQALKGDLLPFSRIISGNNPPGMLMSAHIQYPSLDNTTVKDKQGRVMTIPATLSRKILHDVLRNELGYKGVVVTDALDMAGIAKYFSPEDAMIKAYQAGADIALMPFTIRTPQDIQAFAALMEKVSTRINDGEVTREQLKSSLQRIAFLKGKFNLNSYSEKALSWRVSDVDNKAKIAKNKQIEKALSEASVTALYGREKLPLTDKVWLALMPDALRCLALEKSLSSIAPKIGMACIPLTRIPNKATFEHALKQADLLLVGDISPQHAVYEMKGFDSTEALASRDSLITTHDFMKSALKQAKAKKLTTVFVPLRMPYVAKEMQPIADIAIATFSYNVDSDLYSPIFDALVETLLGMNKPNDYAPVQWGRSAK